MKKEESESSSHSISAKRKKDEAKSQRYRLTNDPQALAALLGALLGGMFGLAAAVVTAYFSLQRMNKQLDIQLTQVSYQIAAQETQTSQDIRARQTETAVEVNARATQTTAEIDAQATTSASNFQLLRNGMNQEIMFEATRVHQATVQIVMENALEILADRNSPPDIREYAVLVVKSYSSVIVREELWQGIINGDGYINIQPPSSNEAGIGTGGMPPPNDLGILRNGGTIIFVQFPPTTQ